MRGGDEKILPILLKTTLPLIFPHRELFILIKRLYGILEAKLWDV
jgi:hypothetical protein